MLRIHSNIPPPFTRVLRGSRYWLLALVLMASCATDDSIPITNEEDFSFGEPTTEKDYVLFTRSGSSSNGFITGFDSLPAGAIDVPNYPTTLAFPAISGGGSYRNYAVNQQKLFGGPGYERVILDSAKVPQQNGIIETFGGGSGIYFLNDEKAYYTDFNTLNIQIIDPSTFNRIGEIDLSQALIEPNNQSNYFQSLYIRGNRLYACLYTGLAFPPFAYQSPLGSIVAIIDTDTDSYLGSINLPATKYPGQAFYRFFSNSFDESGNLYLPSQGGLGLETDPNENTPAAILKIPAGTDDFDPTYRFIPQLQIEASTATIVVNGGFIYAGDGFAYTNVLMEDPATPTDLVNRPLMRWAKLDLEAQTAVLVENVPANVGFTAGMAYQYEDRILLTVYNPEEGISALYETSPDRNDGDLRLEVTAGGIIYGLYAVDVVE
ncbi:MAG: hypothetical protein AAGH79_12815 [Bacteroidota bacterium]